MAVQYAHARYISRKGGGSATRSAAYNGRDKIVDERTGQTHQFIPDPELAPEHPQYREEPVLHRVLLPGNAPAAFNDPAVLWNAAEAMERRKDSQVAREVLLALPSDSEVTQKDWIEMATTFARAHFVDKGLAVQLDIHNESRHRQNGKEHNPHAHLLITTRRVGADGLAARKATDLDPAIRNRRVTDGERWGETWRQHQNAYFEKHGLSLRVQSIAMVPRTRLRQRSRDPEALRAHIEANRRINAVVVVEPARLPDVLAAVQAERRLAALARGQWAQQPPSLGKRYTEGLLDVVDAVAASPGAAALTAAVVDVAGLAAKAPFSRSATKASRAGRINPQLDSQYNRGGGTYEEYTPRHGIKL